MVEKRNRNGGRDREEDRDDDEQGPVEAEARHVQEAPQTKPAVQAKAGMGAGTRLVLLLLIIALAGLGYRYWGFWQSGPTEATGRRRRPAVTVAKPLVKEMQEWSDFTGQFEARESVEVRAAGERLPRIHQFHRRPTGQEGRSAVRHRAAALRARAGDRQGAAGAEPKRSSSWPRRNSTAPRNCARTIMPRKRPMTSAWRR